MGSSDDVRTINLPTIPSNVQNAMNTESVNIDTEMGNTNRRSKMQFLQ